MSAPTVLAIDPGTTESAYVLYSPSFRRVLRCDKLKNDAVLDHLRGRVPVVIEQVESFGMPVGRDIFETVYWSGRFHQEAARTGGEVHRLPRRAVKLHLCNSARAKDANVRQALLDRFPGGKGTKASPGPLYGVAGDMWAALAVAVTWTETHLLDEARSGP